MFCTSTSALPAVCVQCPIWLFAGISLMLSRYVARFIYLSVYLFEMNCLASLSLGVRVFHDRGYFKEAVAKLMLGAVRQCLYSKSGASLSRIGQSAPGGLLYQGPPSKLRGTTKNLSTVVEQLLITHRIRYTRCRGKLPSGYTLFCHGVQQRSFKATAAGNADWDVSCSCNC